MYEFNVCLWGLLLKGVQDVNRLLEPDGVNRAVRIARMVLDNFQHA